MEEDNLEMGMFDNLELNFEGGLPSYEDTENEDTTDDDQENENINDAAEDEDPGEVGSEDDLDEDSNDDEDASSSSNLFSSLANVLHEQGLLPSLDINNTKIESVDDFTEAFKKELDIQAAVKLEEYLSNIDVQSIAQSQQMISNLESINETHLAENIELAKNIIYQDYLNQGLDDKKAVRLLNRLIDLGDDAIIEDATESLGSLKEFENRKIAREKEAYQERIQQQKEAADKFDADIKKIVFEKTDLINGFKPTKALQEKVYKSINEIVGKSPDGEFENKFMRDRRMNPLEFESRMYFFYELTNGFQDYSKLTSSAKSSAVKDLEKVARKTTIKDNGTPLWAQDSQSYDNIGPILNI